MPILSTYRTGCAALLVLSLWAGLAPAGGAPPDSLREQRLKAVLLFNLVRFVDWPTNAFPSTNSPLVIGLLGRDPFGQRLDEVVAGETVNGHPVRIERYADPEVVSECHLLYISASERLRAREIVEDLRGRPILTVSDLEDFSRRYGGMVTFYVNEEKKIRLRLNLAAAKSAGLTVSSKLIQVSELVQSSSLSPASWNPAKFRMAGNTPERETGQFSHKIFDKTAFRRRVQEKPVLPASVAGRFTPVILCCVHGSREAWLGRRASGFFR